MPGKILLLSSVRLWVSPTFAGKEEKSSLSVLINTLGTCSFLWLCAAKRQLHRSISDSHVPLPPKSVCYHNVTAQGSALTLHSAFSKVPAPQSRAAFTCKQICLLPFHSSKICQSLWNEREATNKDFWHLSCFPQTRAGYCPKHPRERGSSWCYRNAIIFTVWKKDISIRPETTAHTTTSFCKVSSASWQGGICLPIRHLLPFYVFPFSID